MPSPSSGADPDELMECASERCLVIKSRLNRDVDQRHAGLAHQFFRVVNATLNQPLVSGGAVRGFELAVNVTDGKSAYSRTVGKPSPPVLVLINNVRRT